ncbi:MAG: ABC transporter permease subunit [Defluviitaleaceae bacterium]|nr:ABC transporter permease subunit [Defluviitaleaceae bacterium]
MKVFISYAKRWGKHLLAVLFWLVVWHIASVFVSNSLLLVSPIVAFGRLFELGQETDFWRSIWFSLTRIVGGFVLAVSVGVLSAAITYRFKFLYTLTLPVFNVIKSIPVASFIILALFWVGRGNLSVFIAFVTVLPIVYFNSYEGIASTNPQLLEMAKVFAVPKHKTVLNIYGAAVLPFVVSAASSGLGFAFKAGVAAELVGFVNGSIGFGLRQAQSFLQIADVFAWTIAIVLLTFIIEKLFSLFLKRVKKWQSN